MDKILNFGKPMHVSIDYRPIFGKGDTLPIDQQPVQHFNIDPSTGHPLSDITAIVRSQGLDQQRLLANLQEFRADFLPDDVSNEMALKYAYPRLCQMPSELAEHSDFVTSMQLEEKRIADEAKELEEFKNSLKKDDDLTVDDSKTLKIS